MRLNCVQARGCAPACCHCCVAGGCLVAAGFSWAMMLLLALLLVAVNMPAALGQWKVTVVVVVVTAVTARP